MIISKAIVDWEFLSEEKQGEPWPPEPLGSHGSPSTPWLGGVRRFILVSIGISVLLTAGIGGVYARNKALAGVQEVERGVVAAVDAGQWVDEQAPELSAALLMDDIASSYVQWMASWEQHQLKMITGDETPSPDLRVDDTWFSGRSAAAELTLTMPPAAENMPAVYRQTRFYRETERGWLRTQPDPALWGPESSIETDQVTWRYRLRDEAAVLEVAGEIDSLYARLLRDYGLAQPEHRDRPVILVQVDALPRSILLYSSPSDTIVVASPSVYLAPAERADAEILMQSVTLEILKHMWAQAVAAHGIEESWPSMAGVSLWELWETDNELTEYRDDILQWSFGAVATDGVDPTGVLPERYQELCVDHAVWVRTPIAMGLPLYCDRDKDSRSRQGHVAFAGSWWDNMAIGQAVYLHYSVTATMRMGHPVMMYTVIDYAVSAYGLESLPAFVAALGQHEEWATLVPAVFDVSLEQFEEGWRQHTADLTD